MNPDHVEALRRLVSALEVHQLPDDLALVLLDSATEDVRRCADYIAGVSPTPELNFLRS